MGSMLILIGGIMMIIGVLMFCIAAFSEGVLWGLAVLLIPIVPLFFAIVHWDKAKSALGVWCTGLALIIVGAFLGGHAPRHRDVIRGRQTPVIHERISAHGFASKITKYAVW